MTNQITSAHYRRLMRLTDVDAQAEMDAESYVRLVSGQTANGLLRNLDSSHVDTETPAKTEFGEWLVLVSPCTVVHEFTFLRDRKFRADWAIPSIMILFEFDGVMHHASKQGAWRDAEKGNLAQLAGWLFIRVNNCSLRDGTGYQMAMDAFQVRGVVV